MVIGKKRKAVIMTTEKKKVGFGADGFDKELRRQIAIKGGKAAHALGRAHEWNRETAREAGRKGGLAAAAKRRAKEESSK